MAPVRVLLRRSLGVGLLLALAGCSDSDAASTAAEEASSDAADGASLGEESDGESTASRSGTEADSGESDGQSGQRETTTLDLSPEDPTGSFVVFTDPETGFRTHEVRDVDREIVYFDDVADAMVWSETGDAVSGWSANGNDLSLGESGTFQVAFGSEAGERRAYFTETATGTICNLNITAPESLRLFGTDEPPPNE